MSRMSVSIVNPTADSSRVPHVSPVCCRLRVQGALLRIARNRDGASHVRTVDTPFFATDVVAGYAARNRTGDPPRSVTPRDAVTNHYASVASRTGRESLPYRAVHNIYRNGEGPVVVRFVDSACRQPTENCLKRRRSAGRAGARRA